MKDELLADTLGRRQRRNLRPLARIAPFVGAHPMDAILGLLFLLASAVALLVVTRMAGRVIDRGFAQNSQGALIRTFVWGGVVVAVLAGATGLRLYSLDK